MRFFGLSPTEIAKAAGCSRPYASRLLSPNDSFQGSSEFFRRLETRLGELVAARKTQFFTVEAVPVIDPQGDGQPPVR
ncbi:hypothetical protein HQ590_10785 [bacterium]|nr:hypothetical protein [bacterium]